MKRTGITLATLLAAASPTVVTAAVTPSAEALRQRNLGIAELENEQPAKAEEAFLLLVELVPDDPLATANLAIATLRQQNFEEARAWIAKALEIAPGDPRILAIEGEVGQWSGEPDQAFESFSKAAAGAPDNVEIQYALFRQATTYTGEGVDEAAGQALERLVRLRPENLVVILHAGQRAIAAGDRTTASGLFLRVRDLLWQAPPASAKLHDQVLEALESGDVEAARIPALRLENVLKITPMYKESLRGLATGIQGVPLARFRNEPPGTGLGDPVEVRYRTEVVADDAVMGRALAVGDFDGDGRQDLAWISAAGGLRTELSSAPGDPAPPLPATGLTGLVAADLDNDGHLDLVGHGADRITVWRGAEGGAFSASDDFGLDAAGAVAATVIDFDIEGDLDLALAGGRSGSGELFRNSLTGPLEAVGDRSLPADLSVEGPQDLLASDLDRDGDLDLLLAHDGGLTLLDNLRQGLFADRTREAGLGETGPVAAVASVDLDNDGYPDLVTAGQGLRLLHNVGGGFESWDLGESFRSGARFDSVVALDADNDGRADLAAAGPAGVIVATRRDDGDFAFLRIDGAPKSASTLLPADLDGDGDLDLAVAGETGVHRLVNEGGNANHWLSVRLRGLDKGSSKNNIFGVGSSLEVRAGDAYQFQEATTDETHFGLGRLAKADLLRVVWTNGVPQNRLSPEPNQRIVEEQVLKGSCPFLYAWNGREMEFVTDLLWGAPIGMPVAQGVWASADPEELVRVDGARPVGGRYLLRVTEELWEAAFFDRVRLWVVDHPAEVEVASSLRVLPGRQVEDRVLGTRGLRGLAGAWDAAGREVTDRLAHRDEIYADGWEPSRYQGVAAAPWTLTFDLGAAPETTIRLHLDGWIFPADASLNLAVAQRADLAATPPRLEVETARGWQTLDPEMGFPAGKTKTMVVDTPPLPAGARRLRIVSGQWLSWDRIVWSTSPADDDAVVVARLDPGEADLHYRGFSAMTRTAPNGPHDFDYDRVRRESPWESLPGRYTRYGDVVELLTADDDRSVILGPGDEISLRFDADGLPPVPPGHERTIFLESHGWDKDADRNTWAGDRVEPLPFRAMTGYPYATGERFPDTPLHRDYVERWLTRIVQPAVFAPPPSPEAP